MHVTRVELDNIKSYEKAVFDFSRGTTAIVGKNGAGKTTILEAIAWALFDSLEYSKTDFVRRGVKKGTVRVTFQSDIDEREYMVYRDTGNGYYIYDPVLKGRIAEQKKDVSDWLHLHLGVEPGTEMKALFRSAIGVPQGLFTAAFLETSVKRKSEFDRLLKVEEYRAGAEKLLETVTLINTRKEEAQRRISHAEGKLARYDSISIERANAETSERELAAALLIIEAEAHQHLNAVTNFDSAERALAEARTRLDRVEVERANAERRLQDAEAELAQATQAAANQTATQVAHDAHITTLTALRELDAARIERDRVRVKFDNASRLVLTAENELRRAVEALENAARAREALVNLQPEIERQIEIEKERERVRELRAQAFAAQQSLTRLDSLLEDLREQHRRTKEEVRAAEPLRDAAKRMDDLENERKGAETRLANALEAATQHEHLTKNQAQLKREVERLRGVTDSLKQQINNLQAARSLAASLAEAEDYERETTQRLAHLRAEIARDERMQREVKGGLCPILSARCLNIPEGETLETYFVDQLAATRTEYANIEVTHRAAQVKLKRTREAAASVMQLQTIETQYEREAELLRTRERDLRECETQLAMLDALDRKQIQELKNYINGINLSHKAASDDALRYAKLESMRVHLEKIEEEGKRRKNEREDIVAVVGGIEQLETDMRDCDAQLARLNDPRGRALTLKQEAAREADLGQALELARTRNDGAQTKFAQLETQLKTYAHIEDEWQRRVRERDETAEDYRSHLAAAALAATLPARQARASHASQEVVNLQTQEQTARATYEAAHNDYDKDEHTAARTRLQLARERVASTGAQLAHTRERLASVIEELTALEEVRRAMQTELAEVERLRRLYETTDFVRDTLKKAGPLVTESYLVNISIEANQLFREITGDANRSLRWTRDYEVILEEDGHERSFPNLSGGEQMVAALSVRLALLKQLSDIRLAIFDEPTVNMDAERRARLAEAIGQVRHFDQLFVISHDDAFEETADHVISIGIRDEGEGMNEMRDEAA